MLAAPCSPARDHFTIQLWFSSIEKVTCTLSVSTRRCFVFVGAVAEVRVGFGALVCFYNICSARVKRVSGNCMDGGDVGWRWVEVGGGLRPCWVGRAPLLGPVPPHPSPLPRGERGLLVVGALVGCPAVGEGGGEG